jgi:dTDP-4-amino-4,6-dideoxygalactose transaminase
LRVFNSLIADCKGVVWQRQALAQTQNPHYLVTGRVDRGARNEFCRRLAAAGIPVTPFYPHTLYQNPVYRRGGCRVMSCPIAETRIHDSFWLSHRPFLAPEETIQEIAGVVRAAVSALPVSVLS